MNFFQTIKDVALLLAEIRNLLISIDGRLEAIYEILSYPITTRKINE